ncbi:member of Set1p complex, histone methyl transferase [Dinochytrium kinnereticum]|nr:member of Set1p complex, histone methyl transferase [Dinochytrium kinnereticum]
MAPNDDQFISASTDGTVRVWDLRAANAVGSVNVEKGRSCIAFDPTGVLFAVGTAGLGEIRLYDMKMPGQGPFTVFQINGANGTTGARYGQSTPEWTSLKFSNCGKHLLVVGTGGYHMILDAMEGTKQHTLLIGESDNGVEMDACFTPDGNYVLGGGPFLSNGLYRCSAFDQIIL